MKTIKPGVSFVVKVQLPLATNGPESVLIYNKNRSIEHVEDGTETVAAVRTVLGDSKKAYFYANLNKDKYIILGERAPDQNW